MSHSLKLKLTASICIHLVALILLTVVLPARYEEIDDILMMMAGSGFYTGTPDSHWLYIHPFWSASVTALYKISPYFDWYSLSFLTVYLICGSWIYYELIKIQNWLKGSLLYFLWFFIFIVPVVTNLQFTTTSAVAASASLFALVASVNQKRYLVLSTILIAISVLIRNQMLVIYAFVCLPFLLYHFISTRSLIDTLKLTLPLFVGALTFLSFFAVQQADHEWKSFYSFSLARNKMVDNIGFLTTDKQTFELEKINYTANDLKLIQSFITEYPEHQKVDVVKHLESKIKPSPSANLPNALRSAGLNFLNIFFLLFLAIMVVNSSNKRSNISLALAIVFMFAGFAFIVLSGNFLKVRVVNSGLLLIGTLALALNCRNKLSSYRWVLPLLIIFTLGSITLKANSARKNYANYAYEHQSFTDRLNWLCETKSLVVDVGYSMKTNHIRPFSNFIHIEKYRKMPYYNLSWYGGSPIQLLARKKLGINSLSDTWLTKNSVFVMDTLSYKPDLIVTTAHEKSQVSLRVDTLKQLDKTTFAYQFSVK